LGGASEMTRVAVGLSHYTDTLRGVQLNAVMNMAEDMDGVQMAAFSNMSTTPFKGVQLAGVSNISLGVKEGTQMALLLNVSSDYMRGVQIGGYNYADSLNGFQLGLLNVARSHPRGWQVGLVNITRDTIAHKMGLVNVNPLTAIDIMIYGGNRTKLNAAVRFRNRSTYSVIGVGSHYMGLDEQFSGALIYRIGQYFKVGKRWSVSGDLGYAHIETFEHQSANKPDRLYSLQARLNVDYTINSRMGAFVSAGYGNTRYYHPNRHYRSGALLEGGVTLRYQRKDNIFFSKPSIHAAVTQQSAPSEQHPWLAVAEAAGINVLVHCFDRFVLQEDFAKTTMKTMRKNISHGFVWDNDQFATNLFAHPYHGNLYYNAARSNGLNFWQSAPYALGGSLMWEYFGEIEPPAINDLMATTLGGICIGEVTHRVSDLVINEQSRGFRRFLREAAVTLIDPMKGLNRLMTGEAWRVRSHDVSVHHPADCPVDLSMALGDRYLADEGAMFRGEHNPFLNVYLQYGEPLNETNHNRPYDFFNAEVTVGMSSNQPLINRLSILGRLWSTPMMEGRHMRASVGFYQHFNYFDSKPVKDGSMLTPYRISEAASIGPGAIFEFKEAGSLSKLEQRVFLSGILLGGTKSDYYNVIDRDYNMGSGFSVKSKTHMELRHFGRFILKADYFQLFTWKGYEQKDLSKVNPLYLNAQGDCGNARLLVVNPITEFDVGEHVSIMASGSYYRRRTHYKYYNDVKARTFEVRAGLTYHF